MFCVECGKTLGEQNNFCAHCGTPRVVAAGTTKPDPVAQQAKKDPLVGSTGTPEQVVDSPAASAPTATTLSKPEIVSLLDAARAGDAEAQCNLGEMYSSGHGGFRDYAAAAKWYRQAAEQGHADAQFNLGLMYATGEGMPQDDAEAAAWYRQAAEQGHADAQFKLGLMYANGQGVPRDDAEAAAWYRQAAVQGDAGAQHLLGVAYAEGQGVARDDAEAAAWHYKAAEQGHATAQSRLDRMPRHRWHI
jgi:TPR repeat protein